MRNRKKQQEMIKAKVTKVSREEKLDLFDFCGTKDPTPFEAVKNMILKGESAADHRSIRRRNDGTMGAMA